MFRWNQGGGAGTGKKISPLGRAKRRNPRTRPVSRKQLKKKVKKKGLGGSRSKRDPELAIHHKIKRQRGSPESLPRESEGRVGTRGGEKNKLPAAKRWGTHEKHGPTPGLDELGPWTPGPEKGHASGGETGAEAKRPGRN